MDSSTKTVNGVPVERVVEYMKAKPELIQWIRPRSELKKFALDVVDPDAQWFDHFQTLKSRILAAFGQRSPDGEIQVGETHGPAKRDGAGGASMLTIQALNHVGSTAVPGLAAKAILDIDLVLSDNSLPAEPFYVPRLQAAGFEFVLRNPRWHQPRYFRAEEPMLCHLHVWGPYSPEVERHRIFVDWLRTHEDEKEVYAQSKREASAISKRNGESMDEYNARKGDALREILDRAFKELGYLPLPGA